VKSTSSSKWLLLIHQVPSKPDYLRVRVGRRLRQLGAVPIKNSIYVVPETPSVRSALSDLAEEIQERGGEAVICRAAFLGGLTDGAVEDLVRAARDASTKRSSVRPGDAPRACAGDEPFRTARVAERRARWAA